MTILGTDIGEIFYTLYSGFFNTLLPMMQRFVGILFLPLKDVAILVDPNGLLNNLLSLAISIIGGDITLFQLMIGSGITIYIVFTIFRYFWGTVEFA